LIQYIFKYKLINKIYAINYNMLKAYTFEMLPPDEGGRRTKHIARNDICINVLFGQVFGF